MLEHSPIEDERNQRAFIYLYSAAEKSLNLAREGNGQSAYNLMMSIAFSAFAIEAYINFVGDESIPDWKQHTHKSSNEKLEHLVEYYKLDPETSKEPLRTIRQILTLKESMPKNRDNPLLDTPFSIHSDTGMIEIEWDGICSEEKAQHYLDDVKYVIEMISHAAELHTYPLGVALEEG